MSEALPGDMVFVVAGTIEAADVGVITVTWEDASGTHGLRLGVNTAGRLSRSLAEAVVAVTHQDAKSVRAIRELFTYPKQKPSETLEMEAES